MLQLRRYIAVGEGLCVWSSGQACRSASSCHVTVALHWSLLKWRWPGKRLAGT